MLARMNIRNMNGEPINFDRNNSWWPTALKKDDLFNSNFKLTINVGDISEPKDVAVLILFKGIHYLIGVARGVPANQTLTLTWSGDPPTAGEFFESLGETIDESKTISLTWETGYLVSETEVVLTDTIPTEIYVEVSKLGIMELAILGAVGIGIIALTYGIIKSPKYITR